MKKKLHFQFMFVASMIFALLFFNFQTQAQSSAVTTLPSYLPNNGSGLSTFNFYNSNSYPVMIDTVFAEGTSTGSVVAYLWMNTTPISGQPAGGAISSNPNWTLEHSEVSTFPTASTQRPILSNAGLMIPANTMVGLAVGAFAGTNTSTPGSGFMRYYTVPTGQKDTFTTAGVSIISGDNVSYGATSYATSSFNHPRGFVGSVVFHPVSQTPCAGTPIPNPIIGPDTVCSQSPIQLSSAPLSGSGISYEWEQRPSGTTTWTTIPGATATNASIPNGISTATDFRMKVTCTNSSSSAYSNVLTVETYTFTAPWTYDVESQSGTASNNVVDGGCWIADPNYSPSVYGWNVSGNGTTPSSGTGPNSAHSGTKYFFTEASSGMANNEAGLITPEIDITSLTVPVLEFYYHMHGTDIVSLYVDATDDGGTTWTTLDSLIGEQHPNQSDPWLLKTVELLGFTGSVQVKFRAYKGAGFYGDMAIDDISIIEGPNICTGTPSANPVNAPDTVCAGTAFNLLGNAPANVSGLTYQWQESPAGAGTWTDLAGAASNDFTISGGIFSNTDFRMIVTCTGSNLSDTSNTLAITLNPNITECYCIPEGVTATRYINDFTTTGSTQDIDNSLSGFSPGGYGDFTGTDTLALSYGDAVNFTANIVGGTAGFRVWIDWNHDGVFDPVNEVAYQSNSYASSHTANFPVPNSALSGVTRMRIVSHWGNSSGAVDPCETGFTHGEFEDYTFIITCDTPSVALGNDTFFCAGDSIELNTGNTDVGATFLWSTGETTDTISVDSAGTYSVTVTNVLGCSHTDSIHVEMKEAASITGIDTTINGNGVFYFTALDAQNVDDYLWNFGDGNTSTDEDPTHTYNLEDNYTVRLIVSNNCGSDTATIMINQTSGINQMNPENDQLTLYPNPAKDVITLENISQYKMESVSVYNTLGQLVFSGKTNNDRVYQLKVQRYASGIYHIKIVLDNGQFIQRKFEILK